MTATDETSSIQARAQRAADWFEIRTRDDGSRFAMLKDGAPQWLTDAIREAHGDEMPNDWRYEMAESAVDAIAEGSYGDEDGAGEWADSMVHVYNSDRLRWLAEDLGRVEICDEAARELGSEGADILERIALGEYVTLEQIFSVMFRAIEENDEEA